MSGIHLSGAVVAQNNETTIGTVLDSLAPHCDEVVVVDGGSTDRTPEIAAANPKVRVIHNEFKGNLSVQKNFAFDQCRGDWILMIDTDELLGGKRVGWLRGLTRIPGMSWYSIPRYWLVMKDGELHYLSERPYYRDRQLRLFRNLPEFRYHETEWPIHHRFLKKTGRGRPLRNPPHLPLRPASPGPRNARRKAGLVPAGRAGFRQAPPHVPVGRPGPADEASPGVRRQTPFNTNCRLVPEQFRQLT